MPCRPGFPVASKKTRRAPQLEARGRLKAVYLQLGNFNETMRNRSIRSPLGNVRIAKYPLAARASRHRVPPEPATPVAATGLASGSRRCRERGWKRARDPVPDHL